MTDDEIIQLLKEIDMCTHAYSNGMHIVTTYDITKMRLFAKRVAAAEREACLALVNQGTGEATSSDALKILRMERDRISAAIRARGET